MLFEQVSGGDGGNMSLGLCSSVQLLSEILLLIAKILIYILLSSYG